MRLLMLTRYGRLGASSRVRAFQYASIMREAGVDVRFSPLLEDSYVKKLYEGRRSITAIIYGYIRRIFTIFQIRRYDIVWVEKEIFPWLPAIFEIPFLFLSKVSIIDYDDAIYHGYDRHKHKFIRWLLGSKIDNLMRRADLVTVGNAYLYGRAEKSEATLIETVPTVIDSEKYKKANISHNICDAVAIGWIGTPSTVSYLELVSDVLIKLSKKYSIRCVAIGVDSDQLRDTPFEAVVWQEETEVDELSKLDIGIMPLRDTPWERGKCGYKLIQYMGCSLPIVASPVGANNDIVLHGKTGFLAGSSYEWEKVLETLILDSELRRSMGRAGRIRVEEIYCLKAQAPHLLGLLRRLAEKEKL